VSQGLAWWLWAVVLAAAALPLTLRLFRGLSDRGAPMAFGVGLFLSAWIGWFLASPGVGGLEPVRLVAFCAGAIILATAFFLSLLADKRSRPSLRPPMGCYGAGGLLVLLGLVSLPHGAATAWTSLVLIAALGVSCWWGELDRLGQTLRRITVPAVAGLLLFTIFFFGFLHVRGGFPNVTFQPSDSGAEKFANLSHLTAVMQSRTMPPADPWFAGEPTNYYIGGHMMVGTVAKVTRTEPARAFNLGLALIVGMTAAGAFSLTLNLSEGFGRRRKIGPVRWQRGIAWGAVGAVAVTAFGNLDALHQVLAGTNFDYWRSSRAIHGAPEAFRTAATITEFPAFSAILGDLHAHHMVLPLVMAMFCVAIGMQAKMQRMTGSARVWFRRCGTDIAVLGVVCGMIAATNTWDVFTGLFFVPLAVGMSLRGTRPGEGWRWIALALLLIGGLWVALLGVNIVRGAVPVLADTKIFFLISGIAFGAIAWLARAMHRHHEPAQWLPVVAALLALAVIVAGVGGFLAAGTVQNVSSLRVALRDALVVLAALIGSAQLWYYWKGARLFAVWGSALLLTAVTAIIAVSPLALNFTPPSTNERVAMASVVPPIVDSTPFASRYDIWNSFWEGTLIRPLPGELRTSLPDLLTHWGLFLIPALLLLLAGFAGKAFLRRRDVVVGLVGVMLGLIALAMSWLGSWSVTLLLAFAGIALVMLLAEEDRLRRTRWMFLFYALVVLAFVEVFYVNDAMTGIYVRYNSYFKLTYGLWAVLGALGVVAIRDSWRFAPSRNSCRMRFAIRTGALGAVVLFVFIGMIYPRHAVHSRGGTWLRAVEGEETRTLDGLLWMERDPRFARDHEIIRWFQFFAEPGDRLLEATAFTESGRDDGGSSYSAVGRISAATGVSGLVGWSHHQYQWRGWNARLNGEQGQRFVHWFSLAELNLAQLAEELFAEEPPTSLQIRELKRAAMHPRRTNDRVLERILLTEWSNDQRAKTAAAFADTNVGRLPLRFVVDRMEQMVESIYSSESLDNEQVQFLYDFGINFVIVGDVELRRYGASHPGLRKFEYWPVVFESNGAAIYRVPGTEDRG